MKISGIAALAWLGHPFPILIWLTAISGVILIWQNAH